MNPVKNIRQELLTLSNSTKIDTLSYFFKTTKGSYGEGDKFISGASVPKLREIAKKYNFISIKEIEQLLKSKFHEERMVALFILVEKYKTTQKEKNEKEEEKIFDFYLKNTQYINNWDLVDLSCYKIVGKYLLKNKKERNILYTLAVSTKKTKNWTWLWEKRIAIVSTMEFIKNNEFEDTIKLSKILLKEKHDLLHKAVGWMLREVGKKDIKLLKKFIKENYYLMPRTTLRYSIEKFNEKEKKEILKGNIIDL